MAAGKDRYHACYARVSGIFSNESAVIHLMRGPVHNVLVNILAGQDQRTLCGRLATRHIDIFSPNEATCRECKRRWELDRPPMTQDMSLYNSLHARPSSMKKSHPPVTKPVHPTISEESESEKRAVEMNAVAIWAAESGIRMSDGNRLSSGWESLSEIIRDQYREVARASIDDRQKDQ